MLSFLLIVRCFIVPNSKRHIVTTTYLQYIEDPGQVDSYAWRAALLNFLYHAIAEWKKKTSAKKTLDGNIWVILVSFGSFNNLKHLSCMYKYKNKK